MTQRFKSYLYEGGGQAAGQLEVAKMSLDQARKFADDMFERNQHIPLDEAMPDFNAHFKVLQDKVRQGTKQRHDMPVIDEKDVKALQTALAQGDLDVSAPYATRTNSSDPFPLGLSHEKAMEWMENGLPRYDHGERTDDVVRCGFEKVRCSDLTPMQRQIYFDKCITATTENGIARSRSFLTTSTIILSGDNFILDGHHRWCSALLIDPTLTMEALKIYLPIKKLFPLTLTFTDAVGNQRNN
jgi:hypothetical protein